MLGQRSVSTMPFISADRALISAFFGLLLVGLVMVYSANLPLPSNNAESVFWRGMRGHPIHLLIGILAMLVMTRIPTSTLPALSTPLFFV